MPVSERTGVARLTLQIKRDNSDEYTSYVVRPYRLEHGTKLYTLKKENGTTYTTGFDNGHQCNCPDQTGTRPKGGCKHIKTLKAFGLIY